MVSVHPNQAHQDFDYNFYLDPTKMKMALPGLNYLPSQQPPPPTLSTTSISGKTPAEIAEDPNKKVRKAYTISRSRESWTEQEHDKFLEALQLFDRDWKKIEAFVGSKTVIQIRSHAQKYFLKVQKNGRNEHVPPPRPKRKAVHPYPQKAYKNAPAASLVAGPIQSSTAMLEPEYLHWPDSSSVLQNPTPSATLPSWMCNSGPAVNILHDTKDNVNLAKRAKACHSCYSSSNDSTLRSWTNIAGCNHGNQTMPVRVMPDFAQVYSFIGSVFDPNATEHLERLKKMDPINLKTVLLLIRNLSINLTSPEFEDHRRFLSSFDGESGEVEGSSFYSNFHANKPRVAIPSA